MSLTQVTPTEFYEAVLILCKGNKSAAKTIADYVDQIKVENLTCH